MKYLVFVFSVVILAFSCKKNDYFIQKEDNHLFCGTELFPFYFEGEIKDTSNNNSLVGFTIHAKNVFTGNYEVMDTVTDSTYFFKIIAFTPFDSAFNEINNKIHIRNLSNVLVDSFAIPVSLWLANDTATYNYSF